MGAEAKVIDLSRVRREREGRFGAPEIVAAWEQRKVQLLQEAADLAREVLAGAAALAEAAERFRAVGVCTVQRIQQIDRQIEDIDTAIAHLGSRGDPEG